MNLADKYRPREWSEVIGQDKIVSRILSMRDRGTLGGRAYWLSGKSGQGKTTIARLIASEVADSWNIEELDAGEVTAETIRRIESEFRLLGMGTKTGRAYIVNEAHGLNAVQVRKLLTLLEPGTIPAHVVFCFTTTVAGQAKLFEGIDDSGPLLSRCCVLELAQRDLAAKFAEHVRTIAQREGLDGQPIERYARLIKDTGGNLRAALMAVDSGEMLS